MEGMFTVSGNLSCLCIFLGFWALTAHCGVQKVWAPVVEMVNEAPWIHWNTTAVHAALATLGLLQNKLLGN